MLQALRVAKIIKAPFDAVSDNLPHIIHALQEQGIDSPLMRVAAIATVAVEVPRFAPIAELGGPEYCVRYDGRNSLGNIHPGDGYRFRRRGYISLLGRSMYEEYGQALKVDLFRFPGIALEPETAARILAYHFKKKNVSVPLELKNWSRIRVCINGDLVGYQEFRKYVGELMYEDRRK